VEQSANLSALPECDRRFRSAFTDAAIGIAIVDRSGRVVYANESLRRISGYEEAELYGMAFADLLHADDGRLLRKDGSAIWVRTSLTTPSGQADPTADSVGVGEVIAFVEDLSQRKQVEGALRASEEALRSSDESFRIAAESAGDMIYEWDLRTGEVDVFGPRHQRVADWPVPRNFEAWKSVLHPEDVDRVLSESARHIRNGESYNEEYRIVGRNGKIYHYSNRGQAIRDASGEPYKCVGALCEITPVRQAEQARSELAAVVECSQDFIVTTDREGAITAWNDGARQLVGYTAAEAMALPLAALLTAVDPSLQLLSIIHQGRAARLDEALFLRSNGSQVPVSVSVSPIRQSDGQLTGSAIVARDISARKQAEKEVAHHALHDHLTGLPNRLLLADLLADSIAGADRDASGAAVIFVDLDGFRFINDTLGHEAGDALLQQVAQRLSSRVRHGDKLARMGGDEFMLVVNNVTDDQVALSVADRLQDALREPLLVVRHEIVVTASMGISIYPRDGTDMSALRRKADAAMYEAKQAGKDRIRFYRPAMGAALQAHLEMETDLRHALDRGELRLYFQPIYTAADSRQTAYEALSRWPHARLGFVPPKEFIRLAEDTGLIIRLGEWVLREACRQCRWWQDHGKPLVRVAVNVSSLQIARTDFVATVLGVLRATGLSGNLLDLELTESIILGDIDSAIHKMAELRQHGIRISVDDFGTGYSSLGYLAKLPIDILKIDRGFVAPIVENDAAVRLIHGMISLAHSIGKRVVVEGIETPAQLQILRDLQCDEVQGYLLGRPAPLARSDERPQEITKITKEKQLIA
jgi:diguanylate cyclase (GGDEF)-like protein/PAS domain S-box-containing protein